MIQITPQMRVLVAVEPVDFRRGIDGLARVCRETLGADPFGSAVFVFRSGRGLAIAHIPLALALLAPAAGGRMGLA
jgi:transposase